MQKNANYFEKKSIYVFKIKLDPSEYELNDRHAYSGKCSYYMIDFGHSVSWRKYLKGLIC